MNPSLSLAAIPYLALLTRHFSLVIHRITLWRALQDLDDLEGAFGALLTLL